MDVLVLEARKHLGGRAGSFRDAATGCTLDICQHILLGCCREAVDFFKCIGSLDQVEFSGDLRFISDTGKTLSINSSPLPAPFHMLPSFLRSDYLSAGEKFQLSRVLAGLKLHKPGKEQSARSFLESLSCPESLVNSMFEPMLASALNESCSAASARYARMVLVKSLMETRGGYRIGIPRAPLSQVLADPARRFLEDRGCEVRNLCKLERLENDCDRLGRGILESGEAVEASAWVFAVPPWSLDRLESARKPLRRAGCL